MKILTLFFLSILMSITFSNCNSNDEEYNKSTTFNYTFDEDMQGWQALFADYPAGQDSSYELVSGLASLPSEMNINSKALMISGNNHSDDLMMMFKKKLTGLVPQTDYKIEFEIELASKYPENSVGTGGSPGASVMLAIGAMQNEPKTFINEDNYVVPNFDNRMALEKGALTEDLLIIGSIGIDGDEFKYKLLTRTTENYTFICKTDSFGQLWVMFGTESGFESTTSLYYNFLKIKLTALF